jgi:hypothetical protein
MGIAIVEHAIVVAVEHGEGPGMLPRARLLHLKGELVLARGEVHHHILPRAVGLCLVEPEDELVVAGVAENPVAISGRDAQDQIVVAIAAMDEVEVHERREAVAVAVMDRVVAIATHDPIVAGAGRDLVASATAVDGVVAGEAVDRVLQDITGDESFPSMP